MIELYGKNGNAKVFTDNADNETLSQVINLLNQECVKDSKIRIMPDAHAGKGCVIGTTMTLVDKVIPNLVGVDIGCVDKDTEFLSLDGWHRISEYNNQMIAVYDLDNNSTRFEYPEAFIKNEESEFYHFKTKYGIDQMLSKEHRCLVRRGNQNKEVSRDLPYVLTAEEIVKKHNRVKIGFRDNFVCDIPNIQNAELLKYTDLDLRLIVMYQADGYTSHTSDLLVCGFKKQRKIDRCEKLLNDACIPYNKIKIKDVTSISFRFKYSYKDLSCLYGLSKRQLGIICDECMFWDGSVDCMQYTSTIKSNVDFMQYAFLCNGYRTSIDIDTRDKYNEGVCYRLSIANCRPRVQLAGSPKTDIKIEKSVDGFKYCFTTRTSFWVMRRNGCVCLTGNCGMLSIKLKEKSIDFPKLDDVIRKYVPSGLNIHESAIADSNIYCMDCAKHIDIERAYRSLGTLGGGNHFIGATRF